MNPKTYVRVNKPAPIFNSPNFDYIFGGRSGSEIPLDVRGHPHFNEFVALPGTILQIDEIIPRHSYFIYRVRSSKYPARKLFLDSRFTEPTEDTSDHRPLPNRETVLKNMLKLVGKPYVWGGNWSSGIPDLLQLYPPKGAIDEKTKAYWSFAGVDCSGLLYEATNGATPRNTEQLFSFGTALSIENKTTVEIISQLQPLDMILYPGHVLFVIDSQSVIESKFPYGVVLRNLKERMSEIEKDHKPIDQQPKNTRDIAYFMIRRFFK